MVWIWATLLVYVSSTVAAIALPGSGRVSILGSFAGLVPRYASDAVMPTLLVIGLCLLRTTGEADSGIDRFELPTQFADPLTQRVAAIALSIALVASSAVSSTTLVERIASQDNAWVQEMTPARLLTNLTSDVDAVKTFVSQAMASIISSVS